MKTRAYSRTGAAVGAGCAFWLVIIAINVTVGAFALQYVVSYWTLYAMHAAKHIPFVPAAIAGLFLGQVTIPAAVITWVLSYIL